MQIVGDSKIPALREAFGTLGEVRAIPGEEIGPAHLRDADALIVRTVTQVTSDLIASSPLQFIGTATIGTDHVDLDELRARGIEFASAPGCNARSVMEYVVAALLEISLRQGCSLRGRTLGVVGVGNVGRRVVEAAEALGLEVIQNDPPRQRKEGGSQFQPLKTLLENCDYVTLHVPLIREGIDRTLHLLGEKALSCLPKESVLINTSRGAVVDNAALLRAIEANKISGAVLDVWEGEPLPAPALVARSLLATPHVAGYSIEGKLRATEMVYRALCGFVGRQPAWSAATSLPPVGEDLQLGGDDPIREAVKSCYDILEDDQRMRGMLREPRREHGAYFLNLRKTYPVRREFPARPLRLQNGTGESEQVLRALGFQIESPVAETL